MRLPGKGLNEPSPHGAHAAPWLAPPVPTPTKPAGHCAVQLGWPARDVKEPRAQGKHALGAVDATLGFADPGAHSEHDAAPEAAANDPARQGKHAAGENDPKEGL